MSMVPVIPAVSQVGKDFIVKKLVMKVHMDLTAMRHVDIVVT